MSPDDQIFNKLEDQPAFGRLTSSSCGGLGDRRDPDTSDVSPRACGARLGLDQPSTFIMTMMTMMTILILKNGYFSFVFVKNSKCFRIFFDDFPTKNSFYYTLQWFDPRPDHPVVSS